MCMCARCLDLRVFGSRSAHICARYHTCVSFNIRASVHHM